MNPISRFLAAFSPYGKFITAILATNATWLSTAWAPDGTITRLEWYGLIVANLGAFGVYGVPNTLTARQATQLAAPGDGTTVNGATELEHPQSAANTPPDGWAGGADEEPA